MTPFYFLEQHSCNSVLLLPFSVDESTGMRKLQQCHQRIQRHGLHVELRRVSSGPTYILNSALALEHCLTIFMHQHQSMLFRCSCLRYNYPAVVHDL